MHPHPSAFFCRGSALTALLHNAGDSEEWLGIGDEHAPDLPPMPHSTNRDAGLSWEPAALISIERGHEVNYGDSQMLPWRCLSVGPVSR
ncbi:hypothetical protein PsYK624_129770 [Phanerochaete sordida]|uniref:Uncharacterized protein n=1 Tax=Phanerochaete sordida TaxID=48140 RepID=A0A9P3GKQ7_9APHY|nr:hypothetical protein PsYK624_129770 [Phanerochaete sordida]